jgi:phospholipid transport system substrate-binding protein
MPVLKQKFCYPIYVLVLLLFVATVSADGIQPIDVIQDAIDGALKILNDPKYADGAKVDQLQREVWEVIKDVFDYREISRRSLGRNWKKFSSSQKKEFVRVFSEFLKQNYLRKLKSEYKDAAFEYDDQDWLSKTQAAVKTTLKRQTVEISVIYRLLNRNDRWRVYDVNIEGVSMVKNYRSQFNELLSKESPDRLIERFKKKLEKLKAI